MATTVRVIGVDCASDDRRIGLALGTVIDTTLRVDRAVQCTRQATAASTILGWLVGTDVRTLLAIDAPLGWPSKLSRVLSVHRAGEAIAVDANDLFRRNTDRFIRAKLGKTPLDVGADRIARTAHSALRLLEELRCAAGRISLAWNPAFAGKIATIEVYPAATLLAHGFRSDGYKRREQNAERATILRSLETVAHLPTDISTMEASADALDAAVCLLAARDFLIGEAMPPDDEALAKIEGWIWARERAHVR